MTVLLPLTTECRWNHDVADPTNLKEIRAKPTNSIARPARPRKQDGSTESDSFHWSPLGHRWFFFWLLQKSPSATFLLPRPLFPLLFLNIRLLIGLRNFNTSFSATSITQWTNQNMATLHSVENVNKGQLMVPSPSSSSSFKIQVFETSTKWSVSRVSTSL